VPLLKKALKDDDVYVRIAAAQSLYSLHNMAGIAVLKSIIRQKTAPNDAENPVEELMSMARDKSRVRAVEVLSGIKDKSAQEALEAALNDNAGGVRDSAAIGLARMGNSDYVQQFFDALKDKDENIRATAVSALGAIASPEALDALAKIASDPSARVRQSLMRALEGNSDPAAVDLTVAALKDADADVRSLALGDLSKIPDSGTIALLIKILKDAQSSDAELKASAGLARRGQAVDLTLAAMTLNQRDADLKNLALDVLSADDSEASTSMLAKLMRQDPDPQTRITAAAVLVKRLQRSAEPRP
jgi:HEAT repeat protein